MLTTGIDGLVTFLNPVAERLTGYSCAQARGRPVAEVFRIVDAVTRVTQPDIAVASMLQERTLCLSTGTVVIQKDGLEIAIEDSTAPIRNRSGQVDGAVIVLRDVTAARALVAALAHSGGTTR